jgi:hypothetical protein
VPVFWKGVPNARSNHGLPTRPDHYGLAVDPEGHLPPVYLVALLELRVEVLGEHPSAGLGADLDPEDVALAAEPIPLAEERVIDEVVVHDGAPLVD